MGFAADGEVEDYMGTIEGPAAKTWEPTNLLPPRNGMYNSPDPVFASFPAAPSSSATGASGAGHGGDSAVVRFADALLRRPRMEFDISTNSGGTWQSVAAGTTKGLVTTYSGTSGGNPCTRKR